MSKIKEKWKNVKNKGKETWKALKDAVNETVNENRCDAVFKIGSPDLSKSKNAFENGNCEASLKYIISKYSTDNAENKAITNAKLNNDIKAILESDSSNFNAAGCIWAMSESLKKDGCSNSVVNDIMKTFTEVSCNGISNDSCDASY